MLCVARRTSAEVPHAMAEVKPFTLDQPRRE